jgi:hypothetical protein
MTVLVEPFASVYDDQSRLGVILARGRSGFEAYAEQYSLIEYHKHSQPFHGSRDSNFTAISPPYN